MSPIKEENVYALPAKAFATGIGKLGYRIKSQNVVILGFDTEYNSTDQTIVSYQLSDGICPLCEDIICQSPKDPAHIDATLGHHCSLKEATEDLTWTQLSDWVRECLVAWGHKLRDINTILLVSHFSTAELSHLQDFWEEGEVRRVSAAQVYNASYRINQHQRLVVMDNYHFWNVGNNGNASLFAVGDKFGEDKMILPVDLPIQKVTREYLQDERFRRYALWDAVVCARVFHKFRERLWVDHEIDVIQYPTSASLAMAVYRRHFLSESLPCPEPRVRRQAWLSLWGGRAEAYRQGDFPGKWRLRDVTSLYPTSERLLHELPGPDDWIERTVPVSWRGLCRVRFKFPSHVKYPCLPVCHDGKLIFPLSGVSDCSLDEAQVAVRLGAELEFVRVWEYDRGDTSLTDFMQHFAKVKADCEEEGQWIEGQWMKCSHPAASKCRCEMRDAVGRELAKLMMNSLIGKLSQNKGDVDIEKMKAFSVTIGVPLPVVMANTFYHPEKPKATPRIGGHVMPEWSALILGKARSIMALLLNGVGESLICSTDSMLVPEELNHLVDTIMQEVGVVLTDKNKGKITHRTRVVRNRVYAAETIEGELVFGASHAIHLGSRGNNCPACEQGSCRDPKHNSLRFILSEETSYTKRKRLGLKQAIKSGKKFFSESDQPMVFSRMWDQKRRLLPGGHTTPWVSVEEYNTHVHKGRRLMGVT